MREYLFALRSIIPRHWSERYDWEETKDWFVHCFRPRLHKKRAQAWIDEMNATCRCQGGWGYCNGGCY